MASTFSITKSSFLGFLCLFLLLNIRCEAQGDGEGEGGIRGKIICEHLCKDIPDCSIYCKQEYGKEGNCMPIAPGRAPSCCCRVE